MDYFSICYDSACLAVQSAMHIAFAGRLAGKKGKARYFCIYFFMLCMLGELCRRVPDTGDFAFVIQIFMLYGMSRAAFRSRRSVSCVGAVAAVYISQLSYGVVNPVQEIIFPEVAGTCKLYFMLIIATVISFFVCICCYRAVLALMPQEEERQIPYISLLLFPGLFFFGAELYILRTSYSNKVSFPISLTAAEYGNQFMLLSLQIIGLAAFFCTLYAYRRICRGFQAQAALDSLAQAVKYQKEYISEAQMRYGQTKSFRHDIRNHLSVLCGLLENGEMKEAKDYLQKLQTVSDNLSFPYQTGNPVVDILLGEKLGGAKADGIRTEVSLLFPKGCGIDDFDLCVIFANALDNAISACRLISEERFIRIGGSRQGDFYMLEFENSCDTNPLPAMGTGLLNVRAAAEKYHGAVMTEKTDMRFSLNVLLDLSVGGNE